MTSFPPFVPLQRAELPGWVGVKARDSDQWLIHLKNDYSNESLIAGNHIPLQYNNGSRQSPYR